MTEFSVFDKEITTENEKKNFILTTDEIKEILLSDPHLSVKVKDRIIENFINNIVDKKIEISGAKEDRDDKCLKEQLKQHVKNLKNNLETQIDELKNFILSNNADYRFQLQRIFHKTIEKYEKKINNCATKTNNELKKLFIHDNETVVDEITPEEQRETCKIELMKYLLSLLKTDEQYECLENTVLYSHQYDYNQPKNIKSDVYVITRENILLFFLFITFFICYFVFGLPAKTSLYSALCFYVGFTYGYENL
jgi:Fe2+ transport system protein B